MAFLVVLDLSLHQISTMDILAFMEYLAVWYVKSLKINRSFQPKITFLVDKNLLLKMITVSQHLPDSQVYTALYLFCFFSFLRLSNIVPHALNAFDPTRHLCVGDVIFSDAGATVIIKWSKIMQDQVTSTTVTIPSLGASALCPSGLYTLTQAGGVYIYLLAFLCYHSNLCTQSDKQ